MLLYKQLFQFNVLCLPLLFHRLLDILHKPGEVSTSETLSESLLPPHPSYTLKTNTALE